MQAAANKKTEVMLVLSEEEANWLKAYVQNPRGKPEDESPKDSKMRETFFNGIVDAMDSSRERSASRGTQGRL